MEVTMKKTIGLMTVVGVLCLGLVSLGMAGEKVQGKGKAAKAAQSMSSEEQIKLALSAALPLWRSARMASFRK
jgi:hypothetical protein